MLVNPTVRRRLESQGFGGLDDDALHELAPWLRWSPALGALVTSIGVALASPAVLWALAAIYFLATLLPFHPFDLLYNYGVRRLTGTRRLPDISPQRRFGSGIVTVGLVAAGWAFYVGSSTMGFALGIPLIFGAVLVSVTHFCIPSHIYNTIIKLHHRHSARAGRCAATRPTGAVNGRYRW
jgi:hypothetical protein